MSEKLTKNDPKKPGYSFLEDAEALKALPVRKILELNRSINLNDLTPIVKKVALESFKIETQFKKYKVNYNTIRSKIVELDPWLTESEFEEIEEKSLSLDQSILDLNTNLDNIDRSIELIRMREIEKLVEYRTDLLVDDVFSKSNKLASKFLKKIMIDHINLEMFGKKEKYKGRIVEKIKDDSFPGKVVFLYFNSTPMESIKKTKLTHVMDGNGEKMKVEEIFQSNEVFSKVININSKSVELRVPIYFGMIVCGI